MSIVVFAGCSARSVSSASQVDLLGQGSTFNAEGVSLVNATKWTLMVSTDQDVTVRVSKAAGPNAGLIVLSDLTTVVTSAAPFVVEFEGEANQRMRVTAQASATTAAVNCDFRAVSL